MDREGSMLQTHVPDSEDARKAYRRIGGWFLFSVAWYLVFPKMREFSCPDFMLSVVMAGIGTWLYIKAARKNNYFEFDTIFVSLFILVGFFSSFFYDSEIYPYLFLHFGFNERYINAAHWLFVIGLQAYYLGRLSHVNVKQKSAPPSPVCSTFVAIGLILFLALFTISGGFSYYRTIYAELDSDFGGAVLQIQMMLTSFIVVFSATELYNKKLNPDYRINWIVFGIIVLFAFILMLVGNRTASSIFILSIMGIYCLLFRPINLVTMLLFIGVGIVCMWVLTFVRTDSEIEKVTNAASFAKDMTVNTRNTYMAMEYTDQYGYTWGKTMLGGAMAVVPFSSYLTGLDKNELGSAEVLTDYTYSSQKLNREFIGLGTNIVADLYLCFGWVGVVFFLYILGRIIQKYTLQALSLDYYSLVTYAGIIGYSVYGIRTGFTIPFRIIVWSLLIAYINRSLCNRYCFSRRP